MKDLISITCKVSLRLTTSIIFLFFLSSFILLVSTRSTLVTSISLKKLNNANAYSALPIVRGGGGYAYDDDDDDDNDDDGDQFSEEYEDDYDEEEADESYKKINNPNKESRNKKSSSSKKLWNIIEKTTNIATSATYNTIKSSLDIASPKHVTKKEIIGIWRLDQQIGSYESAANIHLFFNSTLSLHGTNFYPYTFIERNYPLFCSIVFVIPGFIYSNDDNENNNDNVKTFLYKGTFRRKILDPSIIYIKGKIYKIEKTMFGGKKEILVGTFRGRKRLEATITNFDNYNDDDDDDLYDESDKDDDDELSEEVDKYWNEDNINDDEYDD